jgi:hypothetical protein
MLEAMERTRLDAATLARGEPDLRATALAARVGGGGVADASPSGVGSSSGTLYDHMATIAARKRATPSVPPPREPDAVPFGIDSHLGPVPPPASAAASSGFPAPRAEGPLSSEADLPSPKVVLWIGLMVFGVLALVVALWWLSTR